MTRNLVCCLLACIFFGCSSDFEVRVTSKYNGIIDSLTYSVNGQRKIKISNLEIGTDTTVYYNGDNITSKDIYSYLNLYKNGIKVDSTFNYTDLGGAAWPSKMNVIITDNLKLKIQYPDLQAY